MLYNNVCLASIGYELPSKVVTSAEIEDRLTPLYDRLGLPKGRLELMTGIKERRFWKNGARPSSVASIAAKRAIESSGIPVDKFGALFHTSVCRDFLEPATANVEHHTLGLPESVTLFDISNACLGVVNGMITLANMIELKQVTAGVIMAGEMGEGLVESTIMALLNDPSLTRQSVKPAIASLTIGSGAVAVVLAHRDLAPDGHKFLGAVTRCDTTSSHLCTSSQDLGFENGANPIMQTDSEELLNAGCALATRTWEDFKNELGWDNDTVDRVFTHQVGSAHRRLLYQSLNLDTDKDFATLPFLGNVGSVSLPVTLAMGMEKGVIAKGDKVAMLGIGSGLNCVMLGLDW